MGYSLISDILISMFAVYGFYAVAREFFKLAIRKERFYVALELESMSEVKSIDGRIGAGVAMASYDNHFECMPVVLIPNQITFAPDDEDPLQSLYDKGMRVFVERKQ